MGLSTRDLSDTTQRTALVVIGMQRARLTGPDADATAQRVSNMVARARRDSLQVIFVLHCGPQGQPCEKASEGWRMAEGLRPQFPDWVVEKTQFSIFDDTNLAAQLRAVGIGRLIVTGPAQADDVAVSCAAATALGFKADMAEDLIDASVISGHATCGSETADCV